MSAATTKTVVPVGSAGLRPAQSSEASPSQGPLPLEMSGPFAHVPSPDEMEELTDIPDRRVVFRGVDWAFYDRLVDSIPEWRKIHVDFDGTDLEIVRYSIWHAVAKNALDMVVSITAEVSGTPFMGLGAPDLEAGRSFLRARGRRVLPLQS